MGGVAGVAADLLPGPEAAAPRQLASHAEQVLVVKVVVTDLMLKESQALVGGTQLLCRKGWLLCLNPKCPGDRGCLLRMRSKGPGNGGILVLMTVPSLGLVPRSSLAKPSQALTWQRKNLSKGGVEDPRALRNQKQREVG